jgi:hypothetical protein
MNEPPRGIELLAALSLAALGLVAGCQSGADDVDNPNDPGPPADTASPPDIANVDTTDDGRSDIASDTVDTAGDVSPDTGSDTSEYGGTFPESVSETLIHQFDDYTLEAGEETIPCVQWSLDNEEPLYVNSVAMANRGGFHHSNWYVVPEDYAAGPDGYFDCSERNYRGFTAAVQGTVLFAQSTQAQQEVQSFPNGVVTKIPPNHKIVADLHFLNINSRELKTNARLTLGLVHPRDVRDIAIPFVLSYNDLYIPPKSEARFTSECSFADQVERITGDDGMKLYYALPHYHGLGNHFELEYFGGPRDGEQIFELSGFNAEANGQKFDPPVELNDAEGFRFTCGFDNPRDEVVEWGIGGNEMCMMLGFSDADTILAGRVEDGSEVVGREDGIIQNEGRCETIATEPRDQTMPTDEEKQGEMYVPESESNPDIDPLPECKDRPGTAEPLRDPTLTNLETDLFEVGCAFSSCHDAENPAAGLDLTADDLHAELMNHELITPTDDPLVDPGNPEGSWLYRVTANCEPQIESGDVSHMPRNSPTLMDPEMLAMIREWIAQGAKDN